MWRTVKCGHRRALAIILKSKGGPLPIPTYDVLMLPVLQRCNEQAWQMRNLIVRIADDLQLTLDERDQQVPSGGTSVIASRVHWAKTYLKQAGLVAQPTRGVVEITSRGRDVLQSNPSKIDAELLQRYEDFRAFQGRTKVNTSVAETQAAMALDQTYNLAVPTSTPEEQIATASQLIENSLRDTLLTRVLEGSPAFFEKLIIDLLLAMGYGGSRKDAGEQIGGTDDGGIDGIISEDQLGLDRIYLQAKRYKLGNSVGSAEVQAFIGALYGKGASKGVLITTSAFSKSAVTVAQQTGSLRLVLIDGSALTELMVRFNVGVRTAQTVEIKRVHLDYFENVDTE